MGQVTEMLPADCGERCEGCAYHLGGLPLRGRCPECGTMYRFSYLFRRRFLDVECCGDEPADGRVETGWSGEGSDGGGGGTGCGYPLRGLPLRGRCPECGRPYWHDRPRRIRPRERWADWARNTLEGWHLPTTATMVALFASSMFTIKGVMVALLLKAIDDVFLRPNWH